MGLGADDRTRTLATHGGGDVLAWFELSGASFDEVGGQLLAHDVRLRIGNSVRLMSVSEEVDHEDSEVLAGLLAGFWGGVVDVEVDGLPVVLALAGEADEVAGELLLIDGVEPL